MESEKMLKLAGVWLMMLLCLTGSDSATVGPTEQDFIQDATVLGHNGEEREVKDMAHLPEIAAEQPIGPPAHSAHVSENGPCDEIQPTHHHAIDDFLSALNHGWNRDGEPKNTELQRFGICSQQDAVTDFQVSALTHLTGNVRQHQNALKGVQATEVDIWEAEKEEEIILALKFPKYIQPTSPTSIMILFIVESIKADILTMKFNSHFLHPNTQTVCISTSTQFFILTGGRRDTHTRAQLKLRAERAETMKDENGQTLTVSELQEVLMRKMNSSNITMRPMLLFLADGGYSERTSRSQHHGIPLDQKPSSPLPATKTYLFLCELQKFLNDVISQKDPPESEEEESSVSLDTLHSLPPLTLGDSSPQSLLSGLVNSSTPTVFVFPQHQQGLQTHRVELNLETPLLSVLRLRLDEAIAQLKKEEAGQKLIDRLQRLSEMSALPSEHDAVTVEHKEAQYRSVLLLKALQTLLSIWEVERAQRAARADDDGPTMPDQCRLQSLIVSLRKYSLEPSEARINNCEGSCTFPISNISNNHVILLNSHIQSGHPVNRSPCCVPVKYDGMYVMELESKGTLMSLKTNVVATECECR